MVTAKSCGNVVVAKPVPHSTPFGKAGEVFNVHIQIEDGPCHIYLTAIEDGPCHIYLTAILCAHVCQTRVLIYSTGQYKMEVYSIPQQL